MALSSTTLDGLLATIATLESSRASSMATFLGSSTGAGQWSGAGINSARRIQQLLDNEPPANTDSQAVVDKHRSCVERIRKIVAG